MRTAKADAVPAVLRRGGGGLPALAGALCAFALAAGPAGADEPEAAGRFVSVPASISGEAINRISQMTEMDFERFKVAEQERDRENPNLKLRRAFKVVYDFNLKGAPARSADFGLCLKLAESIRQLEKKGVQTIAFVHGQVTGHSVLPVLACQQRAFSAKAKLGPVLVGGIAPLEDYQKNAYRTLWAKPASEALVTKLFEERAPAVVPSKKGGFVAANHPDADLAQRRVFEENELAAFDFARAKAVGLCELDPFDGREEVRRAYRLTRESLQENPLLDGVVAWQIPVAGEVNKALKEQLERRIHRAKRGKANLVVLELRCYGGDTAVANSIAEQLRQLGEEHEVVTVAYVTEDAQDTAAYLAFGCNFIVMAPKAKLGGFGKLLKDRPADDQVKIGDGIEELARAQHYPPALARAMVDSGVQKVFLVTSAKGTRDWDVLTGRQLDEARRERPGHWDPEEIPLDADGFLTLDAAQAERFGLALGKPGDLASVYDRLGVKPAQVHVSGPDWLDDLADFLRNEWTSFLLVMIGITCLFLELKLPGIGLPGVVAALCFVLFFWSHSQLGGQVTWLAILLFLLGLVLIGLEVLVLPGFGVCGISGVLLLLGSLALMTYGHWPQDAGEWMAVTRKVGPFGLVLMGSVVMAVLLARYLPSIPVVNRLLLRPQAEGDGLGEGAELVPPPHAALLGAIGVAATPLRPAGKVQFGDEYVDVVAEGSYASPGTRVQVIEIEGNRIVVKPV